MTEAQTDIGKNLCNNIDSLSDTIKGVTEVATNYLSQIENIQEFAKNKAQEKVDEMCERASQEINSKLAIQRQKVVDKLKNTWASSNEVIENLRFITGEISIDTIVSIVSSIIQLYTKPYQNAMDLITDFTISIAPKLLQLTSEINDLADLKNQIPVHTLKDGTKLNYDKLNITMDPITIDDIRPNNEPPSSN